MFGKKVRRGIKQLLDTVIRSGTFVGFARCHMVLRLSFNKANVRFV
jgi:hypothetical protein